jgi:hypothetical protein
VNRPAGTTQEDQDIASVIMVDKALLGLSVVLLAAFLWMIAGKDDLSNPYLIVSSWAWHASGMTVVAVLVYAAWQLVRWTSWTVRMVFVGIMLLNWILTTWLG